MGLKGCQILAIALGIPKQVVSIVHFDAGPANPQSPTATGFDDVFRERKNGTGAADAGRNCKFFTVLGEMNQALEQFAIIRLCQCQCPRTALDQSA